MAIKFCRIDLKFRNLLHIILQSAKYITMTSLGFGLFTDPGRTGSPLDLQMPHS